MKKIKKIKNIEKSEFYKKITKKIQGDKVKFWEFQIAMEEVEFTCEDSYKMKHRYNFKKVIRGKNEIKWHILQKVINDVNERYNKLKTRSNQITFVNLPYIFDECHSCVLTGTIILEDGDYITIQEEYNHYDDAYSLGITRHKIPKIETREEFEVLDFSETFYLDK